MDDFSYQYAQVRITHFAERDVEALGSDYVVGFNVRYDLAFDEAASVLAVMAHVAVHAASGDDLDTSSTPPLAELTSENVFALKGLDTLRDASGTVRLGRPFVAQCVGIAFSTARGLLVGRARADLFSNAPLPVIRPMELLSQLSPEQPITWLADA